MTRHQRSTAVAVNAQTSAQAAGAIIHGVESHARLARGRVLHALTVILNL